MRRAAGGDTALMWLTAPTSASGSDPPEIAALRGLLRPEVFKDNLAAVVIGSPSTGCAGNVITGNLQIDSNVAPVKVFGNQIHQNLQCGGNAAITGGGNTAKKKQGQCSAF